MISLAVAALIATSPVPVLDVIQIYGRLAGPECFGKTVPLASGASCQLTAEQLRATLSGVDEAACGVLHLTWRVSTVWHHAAAETHGSRTQASFSARLDTLPFRWPLKPFGTADSPSNVKTAAINKNAETAVYMRQLEQRRLYNRNEPTGPLPTSLRPALDDQLSREPISPAASRLAFRALRDADGPLDWFSFLNRVGAEKVEWPPY